MKLTPSNYENSIVGIPNSIMNYFGVEQKGKTLPLLDRRCLFSDLFLLRHGLIKKSKLGSIQVIADHLRNSKEISVPKWLLKNY